MADKTVRYTPEFRWQMAALADQKLDDRHYG